MQHPNPVITQDPRLARLFPIPQLGGQSMLAIRSIMALRILALCGPAGRDPFLELSTRFSSVTAARAFITLADAIGSAWPVNIMVMRPCCRLLSPDEITLAEMIDAAASADPVRHAAALAGLVRPDRHERLFDHGVEFVAFLQLAAAAPAAGPCPARTG